MSLFARSVFDSQYPFSGEGAVAPSMDFNVFGGGPLVTMLGNMVTARLSPMADAMPGQFFPDRSLYTQFRGKQHFGESMVAMQAGAQADRESQIAVLRGLARLTGTPYNVDTASGARSLVDGIAPFTPQLAMMFPETWDSLHGSKGSAAVMARFIHGGGRLGQDPVTGMTGLSGESAGAAAALIQDRYFGPGADLAAFRGLSMGRAGMLYDELQTRGLASPSIAAFTPDAQRQMLAASPSLLAEGITRLPVATRDAVVRDAEKLIPGLSSLPPEQQAARIAGDVRTATTAIAKIGDDIGAMNDLKRKFDATRVGEQLKGLAGVTAAMRDIFGDMGHPDAPMRALVEGLEQLTQQGLSSMTPQNLEHSVRLTRSLAQSTGMGMDQMMTLMAHGAATADQLGVSRNFVPGATQQAASFAQAFGQVGGGNVPNFFGADKDKITLLDARLNLQAAQSGLANQLGAAVRMVERREATEGRIDDTPQALADAIRAHKAVFTDPRTGKETSVFQDDKDYRALMGTAFSAAEVNLATLQSSANAPYIQRNDVATLVRREAQADDVKAFIAQAHRAPITGHLRDKFPTLTPDEVQTLAMTTANAAAASLLDMDSRVLRDDIQRTRVTADVMRTALGDKGKAFSDKELFVMADEGFAANQQDVAVNPMRNGAGDALTEIQLHSRQIKQRAAAVMNERNSAVLIEEATAGIGQVGPLARIVDGIKNPALNLPEFIGTTLGTIDPTIVQSRLDALKTLTPEALAQAGITDRDRLGFMMNQYGNVVRQFTDARAEKDPVKQQERIAELSLQARALLAGGTQAGEATQRILQRHNLVTADIPAVLRGERPIPAPDRAQLQALSLASGDAGGIGARADAAGVGGIGRDEIDAYSNAVDRLRNAAPGSADALRAAREISDNGRNTVEGLIVDPAAAKRLGAGALPLLRGMYANQQKLRDLAATTKKDVTSLLAERHPEAMAAAEAVQTSLAEVAKRQEGGQAAMPAAEVSELNAWNDDLTRSDADKNNELIGRLSRTADHALSPKDAADLANALGTNDSGRKARELLSKEITAREGLKPLLTKHKLSLRDVATRASDASLPQWLATQGVPEDERDTIASLARDAGTVLRLGRAGEGVTLANYRAAMADAIQPPPTDKPWTYQSAVDDAFRAASQGGEAKAATGPSTSSGPTPPELLRAPSPMGDRTEAIRERGDLSLMALRTPAPAGGTTDGLFAESDTVGKTPQRIVGTLTLEGLDRVTLRGTTAPVGAGGTPTGKVSTA